MRRTKSCFVGAATALMATLALTACVKLDQELTINSDNTVDGTVTVAFDKALLDTVGVSTDDALSDAAGALESDNVAVEPYADGRFVGQTVTFDGASLDELNASGSDGDLRITRNGDNFEVTGTLDFTNPMPLGDSSVSADGFEVRIALTFPGEIVSSTGEIDGNTVTWTPEMGDVVDFETVARAEGGAAAGSGRFTLVGLGLAIVAAVGATILVFQQRTKMPAPAPPAASPADPWAAPTDDPRHGLDAAPPAAVPFDPPPDEG